MKVRLSVKWSSSHQSILLNKTLIQESTGYTTYKKLALSEVEKFKMTIFPSDHQINLFNIPYVQKGLPFGNCTNV